MATIWPSQIALVSEMKIYLKGRYFWRIFGAVFLLFSCVDAEERCAFRLTPFTCPIKNFPSVRKPLTKSDIQKALDSEHNGPYLNFAAPILELYPSDIGSLAVFGDSLSAGLFLDSGMLDLFIPGKHLEMRSESWSNGASDKVNVVTIFKLLEIYSPRLVGGSVGSTIKKQVIDNVDTGFSFAVSSSRADDLNNQADRYIRKLRRLPQVASKWKFVNVLVGANNMCAFCLPEYQAVSQADTYETYVRDMLEKLEKAPETRGRMLVNLAGLFDISPLADMAQDVVQCRVTQKVANLCPCLISGTPEQVARIQTIRLEYNLRLKKIAADYQRRYLHTLLDGTARDTHTNAFVVFYQPALEDVNVKQAGLSMLSGIDCFHPNNCGHRVLAYSMFNSYFTPSDAGKRKFSVDLSLTIRKTLDLAGDANGEEFQFGKVPTSTDNVFLAQTQWVCPSGTTFFM